MSKRHSDREAAGERTISASDIHDIRALTSTGAITLPRPDASVRTTPADQQD